MLQFHTNNVMQVRLSSDGKMTRNEEREALSRLADTYRQYNEHYRQTGRPFDITNANERNTNERNGLLDSVPKEALRSFDAPSYAVELSPEAQQILKRNTLEELPKGETAYTPAYTPVTEIHTEHFRWTEADGIVETLTEAEELAARKESFRQEITSTISQSIGEILKPRATYEEAFDALYTRETVAWKASFDDSGYGFTHILTPVHGAFEVLATHLNDYLEQFGREDGYFDTLLSALDELGTGDDNALLQQMRSMVRSVKDGNAIDTQSDNFKTDVRNAIDETYGGKKKAVRRQKDEKAHNAKEPAQAGLSFLEMERRKAKENKQLLDKLTGKEKEEKPESAGEVAAHNRHDLTDREFRDKLRNVDEPAEENPSPASPRTTTSGKVQGTPLRKEDANHLSAAYDAWDKISQRQGWGTTKKI